MPSYATPSGSSLYCSSCSNAVERCHPRSRAKASAETEAERWFSRSPFCSQHSHDIVVMYQGKSMELEELRRRKWQEVAPRNRSSYPHEDGHGGRELHRDWGHRSRSSYDRSKSKDYRGRDDQSQSRKEFRREKRTKKSNGKKSSSDADSESESSDDEDVEARYCRACELALAKCRIRNAPNPAARLESQKYFLSPPVCFIHIRSKDLVKDDELISLEELWKGMKAKQPCDV